MSRSLSLGQAAGDERVRQHHRAGARGPGGEVGADPLHRLGRAPRGASASAAPTRAEHVGLEVGDAVDRDRAVLVVEQHRLVDPAGVGAQVHARRASTSRALKPSRRGGVVVAAGDHHPGPGGGEPVERVVGQRHGVDRRQRPVVDVARDDHEVDLLGLDGLDQVVDVRRLRGEEVLAVERPAEVPVGGVQDAHAATLGEGADRTAPAHAVAQPHAVRTGVDDAALGAGEADQDQAAVLGQRRAPARWAHRRRRRPRPRRRRPSAPARSRSGR